MTKKKGFRMARFGESPESDWKIIFISAVILSVLSISVSAFIFAKIGNGGIFGAEEVSNPEDTALSVDRLEAAVPYYQEKSAEFGRLRSGVVPSSDPSL